MSIWYKRGDTGQWYEHDNPDDGEYHITPVDMKTLRIRTTPPEPEPGWYRCGIACRYVFYRDNAGNWIKLYGNTSVPTLTTEPTTWEQMTESDCARHLWPVF